MRKIYTSIELGSFSIKVVVSEIINNNAHVLASSNTRCKGIENGEIVDYDLVKSYLTEGIKTVEDMLGFKIKEAIVGITSKDKKFDILNGKTKIENENKLVREEDVEKAYQDIVLGKVDTNEELLSIMPISFQVDDGELTKDPKGMVGDILSLKAVILKVPKEILRIYMKLFKECGITITDITLAPLGDYYEIKTKEFDSGVGAIVNVGYDKMDVSIYNKGILIKYDLVPEGSKLIDKDIAYSYKIKRGQARNLKEKFSFAYSKYANINDTIDLVNKEGQDITVNSLEVSEIVENRVVYLLKVAKKQINVLTNREISNIIITGGVSELPGFQNLVENIFGRDAYVLDIKEMGIRNNMYSTTLGLIKYFNNKLEFRGISYSMIKEEDIDKLNLSKEKQVSKEGIFSKVFGYFKDE